MYIRRVVVYDLNCRSSSEEEEEDLLRGVLISAVDSSMVPLSLSLDRAWYSDYAALYVTEEYQM